MGVVRLHSPVVSLLVNFALLLVTLLAVGVSVFAANFAKNQVDAARDQVDAAREQADIARDQAEVARQQVAEAKRANDLAEAHYEGQRARSAVVWHAEATAGWEAVRVINRGFDTAEDVFVRAGGAQEDWDHIDWEHEESHEVPPNEWFTFPLDGWVSPPDRLWVLWRGAGRPLAVEVEKGQRPGGLIH